jgi:dihydropteroate synthase
MATPIDETRRWVFRDRELRFGELPLLMGIVNVTPDSFSDGGAFLAPQAAVDHALRLVDDGADIIDIGGESTRPGSDPVRLDDELQRVIPVIERLAPKTSVAISVDTTKSEVARQALGAGASIVNDISALGMDRRMIRVCAEAGAGVVCMHMQGLPATMQDNPHYDDVLSEITQFLKWRVESLAEQGIPAQRVVIDPGIGFGKTAQHNVEILSHIGRFREIGRPILIGHSRKRFLKALLGRTVEPDGGGLGVSIALAMQGVEILRVHDVRETRNALEAWHAIARRTQ